MLWDEKTASTLPVATASMSVRVPSMSGLTDGSMSKRISRHSTELKPFNLDLFSGPQPTCRKVFIYPPPPTLSQARPLVALDDLPQSAAAFSARQRAWTILRLLSRFAAAHSRKTDLESASTGAGHIRF